MTTIEFKNLKDVQNKLKSQICHKVRKKPIIINAYQITDIDKFTVYSLEGNHNGKKGDWLMIGVNDEIYVCENKIFKKTYDILE